MIHDQNLVDRLSTLSTERIEYDVYRVVRTGADPVAPSTSGGRWAPVSSAGLDIPVLYTSLEKDGALAEVASYLIELTPIPSRPLRVARIHITASRTLKLARVTLTSLGVDMAQYGVRDYGRTQQIGAALSFLNIDGLIAPSARWSCDNVILFMDNHSLTETLEVIEEETIDWRSWARTKGMLPT